MLRGGVGNQLFQWALALELQHRGRRIVLDSRAVRSGRGLAIHLVDNQMRCSNWPSLGWSTRARGLCGLTATGFRPVEEPSFSFWPEVLEGKLPRRAILHGYWQTPRYFPSVQDTVRRQVLAAAAAGLTERGLDLLREIENTERVVSVHLRRGDYVTDAAARRVIGVLTESYYTESLDYFRTTGCDRFYIFSDDIDAAKRLFSEPDCEVVPHTVANVPLGEILLMTACQGHILANSSFSWWGAWLSEHEQVVAPRRWFTDTSIDTSDLLPAHWTRR
jgi:hypothetical protein